MNKLKRSIEFFSEQGDLSMTRLLSFICVLSAMSIALFGILCNRDLGDVSMLCGAFLAAAFGGKIMQKRVECENERE